MSRIFLGLGSNLNDRLEYLKKAISKLNTHPEIEVITESSIYETKPYGYTEQPNFLNMVVEINTILTPLELLQAINQIEDDLGRERTIHWGPRTIDIDILLYKGEFVDYKELQIPHSYITKRLFVLVPLHEIYKGKIPGEFKSVPELINELSDESDQIRKYYDDE